MKSKKTQLPKTKIAKLFHDLDNLQLEFAVLVQGDSSRKYYYGEVTIYLIKSPFNKSVSFKHGSLNFAHISGDRFAKWYDTVLENQYSDDIKNRKFNANSNIYKALFEIVEYVKDNTSASSFDNFDESKIPVPSFEDLSLEYDTEKEI